MMVCGVVVSVGDNIRLVDDGISRAGTVYSISESLQHKGLVLREYDGFLTMVSVSDVTSISVTASTTIKQKS